VVVVAVAPAADLVPVWEHLEWVVSECQVWEEPKLAALPVQKRLQMLPEVWPPTLSMHLKRNTPKVNGACSLKTRNSRDVLWQQASQAWEVWPGAFHKTARGLQVECRVSVASAQQEPGERLQAQADQEHRVVLSNSDNLEPAFQE
jgi:hypothetical protein